LYFKWIFLKERKQSSEPGYSPAIYYIF
jgi:hypothetical protein